MVTKWSQLYLKYIDNYSFSRKNHIYFSQNIHPNLYWYQIFSILWFLLINNSIYYILYTVTQTGWTVSTVLCVRDVFEFGVLSLGCPCDCGRLNLVGSADWGVKSALWNMCALVWQCDRRLSQLTINSQL